MGALIKDVQIRLGHTDKKLFKALILTSKN